MTYKQIAIASAVAFGSMGVFYCQQDKTGGDRIGLVAHVMEMGQQDAAFFIASQFGMELANSGRVTSNSTVPTVSKEHATVPPAQKPSKGGDNRPFDPAAFAQKLEYTPAVEALGITEAEATSLGIGHYRGKLYQAMRYDDGSIAGFSAITGELKLPSRLLPPSGNVVAFPKRA